MSDDRTDDQPWWADPSAHALTHILDEHLSPGMRVVWTMYCGEQCVSFDDGTLIPSEIDFYLEREAHMATCKACRGEYDVRQRAFRAEQ